MSSEARLGEVLPIFKRNPPTLSSKNMSFSVSARLSDVGEKSAASSKSACVCVCVLLSYTASEVYYTDE